MRSIGEVYLYKNETLNWKHLEIGLLHFIPTYMYVYVRCVLFAGSNAVLYTLKLMIYRINLNFSKWED